MYFSPRSSGRIYVQDRVDFNGTFRNKFNFQIEDTGGIVQVMKAIDIPDTFNTYQWRILSSSGTSEAWKLNRVDGFIQGMGIGKYESR